jgi:hypothetical protein
MLRYGPDPEQVALENALAVATSHRPAGLFVRHQKSLARSSAADSWRMRSAPTDIGEGLP